MSAESARGDGRSSAMSGCPWRGNGSSSPRRRSLVLANVQCVYGGCDLRGQCQARRGWGVPSGVETAPGVGDLSTTAVKPARVSPLDLLTNAP